MSGQSSATTLMKVCNYHNFSPRDHNKKGMTFNVIEAIERNSDSIGKLTSLVNKMNMKMDKCET